MTTLRAGLSGCGAVGRRALAHLRHQHDCDVVALHDPDEAALRRCGQEWGIAVRTGDFEALLASGIDFVVLAGPAGLRLPQVRLAADQGVHVLVHTPMALDVATAAAMVAACDAGQVRLGVAVPGQDDPLYEQLRRMLAAGWLGGPVAVHGVHGEDELLREPVRTGDWRRDPALAGRAPLLRLASHLVHLATWLTGRPALEVTCQHALGLLGLPADSAAATARLGGGVLATFLATHQARAQSFGVLGTDGWLKVTGDRIGLRGCQVHRGPVFDYPVADRELWLVRHELPGIAAAAGRAELHGRFARWIDDSDDFPCPGEQGLADLAAVEAMERAAASGRTEPVHRPK